jgi:hypothetical protein
VGFALDLLSNGLCGTGCKGAWISAGQSLEALFCPVRVRAGYQDKGEDMTETTKLLLAYDGSAGSEAMLEDLQRAGLPAQAEVRIVTVAEMWLAPTVTGGLEINTVPHSITGVPSGRPQRCSKPFPAGRCKPSRLPVRPVASCSNKLMNGALLCWWWDHTATVC